MAANKRSITVTFKEKEKELYDEAMKHSSPSAFLKDALKEKLDRDSNTSKSGSPNNHGMIGLDI